MHVRKFICVLIAEKGAADFVIAALEDLVNKQDEYRTRIYASELVLNFIKRYHSQIASKAELFLSGCELLNAHSTVISAAHCFLSSATSRRVELEFSNIAKVVGIPIIHIVDAHYGFFKRTVFSGSRYYIDKIVVIDEECKKVAISEGLQDDAVISIGHPGWETIASGKLPVQKKQTKMNRNSLFLGAPIERDYGKNLGFNEGNAWNLLVEAWRELPLMFNKVIYCPHPQQTEIPELHGAELVTYDTEMLLEFNQVFGVFSAPLIHAALVGCISISLQPVEHDDDICAFSRKGYIQRATSILEIRGLLEKYPESNCRNFAQKLNGSNSRLLHLIYELAVINSAQDVGSVQ